MKNKQEGKNGSRQVWMQTAHKTLGGKFFSSLGLLCFLCSPSFFKPLMVLVEISYLWYCFLGQGHSKKEAEVRCQGEILMSTLPSMKAGDIDTRQ